MSNNYLMKENPILIVPLLARRIGEAESLVVQQIYYWLGRSGHLRDGRYWMYNSIDQWQSDNFDWWSISKITRVFKNLRDAGIVLDGNYNDKKWDRKLWYTIEDDKFDEKCDAYYEKRTGKSIESLIHYENELRLKKLKREQDKQDAINAKRLNPFSQNEQMHSSKMTEPIAETTTETTAETNSNIKKSAKASSDSNTGKGTNGTDEQFEAFWKLYPKKVGKTATKKQWEYRTKKDKISADDLIKASANYGREKARTEQQYILNPSTFLGPKLQFEDYVETASKPTSSGGDNFRI